jgi:hypothetical protein
MPCVLHLMGESFDPSTVPELSTLRPYSTYRRGDKNRVGSGFTEVGGVSCEVSPREQPIEQVEDASYFLMKHQALLRKLVGVEPIRYRTLSFIISAKILGAQDSRMNFPPTLLRLCSEVNVGIGLVLV